jgi:hypothetical protein
MAAVNLCTNPSFEANHDNWQSSGGGTIQRVSEPWSGAFGLQYQGNNLNYGHTAAFNITNGQQVAISFYIKNKKTTADTITVELYHSSTVRATWNHIIKPNEWKRVICHTIVTHSQSYQFRILGNALNVIVDAVQIEIVNGHSATTYFDGGYNAPIESSQVASPQYAWNGTPHESTSVRNMNAANGGLLYNLQDNLGFMVVGFQNADNPALDNQTVDFFGTDGAALQDIIVPPRNLTVIGYIYGQTPNELNDKVSRFLSYFAQDTTAIRQAKSFVYQNYDGDEPVGIPLTFSGVIASTTQIPLGNNLSVQCSLQIRMLDPFFYGHDEGCKFNLDDFDLTGYNFARARDLTNYTGTRISTYLDEPGVVNGTIYCMAKSYTGMIYFGGDFTSVAGITVKNFAGYNPFTDSFFTVGTNLATLFNGAVRAIECLPTGGVYVGGEFTTTDGLTTNRFTWFFENQSPRQWFRQSTGGAVYGLNGAVYAIKAKPLNPASLNSEQDMYIGGAFTGDNSGNAYYRILRRTAAGQFTYVSGTPTTNGVNNTVRAIALNISKNELYIGGQFTTTFDGLTTLNRIATMSGDFGSLIQPYYTGVNATVQAIAVDQTDGTVYIGGDFTATAAGSTLLYGAKYSGSQWVQVCPATSVFTSASIASIIPYRNGFLFMGYVLVTDTDNFNGFFWYNGQSAYPVPFGNSSPFGVPESSTCAVVANNGDLYIGSLNGGINYTGVNTVAVNTGTAAAPIIWQIDYTDFTSATVHRIRQFVNNTQMTSISFNQLIASRGDFLEVNTGKGTIESFIAGDVTRYVLSASGITNMRCLPGNNDLTVWRTADFTSSSAFTISAYWKQTFNSLFDGARKL